MNDDYGLVCVIQHNRMQYNTIQYNWTPWCRPSYRKFRSALTRLGGPDTV